MGPVLPWLPWLRQPQTAARLLSACVSTRPQYLSRTIPPSTVVISSFTRWDARLEETFRLLLASGTWACREDAREAALDQIFLPICLRGFGIRRMARVAPSFTSGETEQIDPTLRTALEGLPFNILSLLPSWPSCASASPDSLFCRSEPSSGGACFRGRGLRGDGGGLYAVHTVGGGSSKTAGTAGGGRGDSGWGTSGAEGRGGTAGRRGALGTSSAAGSGGVRGRWAEGTAGGADGPGRGGGIVEAAAGEPAEAAGPGHRASGFRLGGGTGAGAADSGRRYKGGSGIGRGGLGSERGSRGSSRGVGRVGGG
ncbi:unnamed protein product [Closterium sp. Naga37s-1]|nr:unnamed protein product [Closterium sp. Naga37s-1]